MDFTGRPMEGYVYVAASGAKTEKAIRRWVELGAAFVATLEGGAKKKRRKARAGKQSAAALRRAPSRRGGAR